VAGVEFSLFLMVLESDGAGGVDRWEGGYHWCSWLFLPLRRGVVMLVRPERQYALLNPVHVSAQKQRQTQATAGTRAPAPASHPHPPQQPNGPSKVTKSLLLLPLLLDSNTKANATATKATANPYYVSVPYAGTENYQVIMMKSKATKNWGRWEKVMII
jgi:hypothetical protein